MSNLTNRFKRLLDHKLAEIDRFRPISRKLVGQLKEQFKLEMTYNSNAIEGNSLSLKETFLVINEGLTVKGKPLKDHLEAKDHHEALNYLYELVEHGNKPTVSQHFIRALHQLVTGDTEAEEAGKYREGNVIIFGAEHTPPEAFEVPKKMGALIEWLGKSQKKMHVVELAAQFHHKLVHIHPFLDGNGRTARLAMNLLLMKEGYPLVTILKTDRKKYYRVLQRADDGDLVPLVQFIAQAVERSLNLYIKVLKPKKQRAEIFLPLSKIAPKTPYSPKYLNLLLLQGKLDGHKEGRNWVTSEVAVNKYMSERKRHPMKRNK